MRFTEDRLKADLIRIILNCRGENCGGSEPDGTLSWAELNSHKLIRRSKKELIEMVNEELSKRKPDIPSVMDVVLEDDDSGRGGTMFLGETVRDFLDSIWPVELKTLDDLNEALVISGIKPLHQTAEVAV